MPLSLPPPEAQITFAVPFYANLDYLRVTLDSVLAQTSGAWQVLVCDDGNPKESAAALVASYNHPRFAYHRNKINLGLAGNWNRCLDLATTPLVTLLHSDDALLPEYTATMVGLHRDHPEITAFYCRARIIGPDGRPCFSLADFIKRFLSPSEKTLALVHGDRGLASILAGNYIMCPTLCYNRQRLGTRRFDDQWRMVLDLEMIARMLLDGDQLMGTPAVCYAYRRSSSNQTSILTQTLERFHEEIAIYGDLAAASAKRGWSASQAAGQKRSMIKLHILYRLSLDLFGLRPRLAWAKTKLLLGSGKK